MIVLLWIVAGGIAVALAYQAAGSMLDARRYPPPGQLFEVNGQRLHLFEEGEGAIPVILEAGIAGSSLSWRHVQGSIARFARVISYDRAGLGWSSASRRPRNAKQTVEDLRDLLREAGLHPPYVLVGHSFGGLTMRLYATLHPEETAGLVLVDPVAACEWQPLSDLQRKRLQRGALLSRRGGVLAHVGVVRFATGLLLAGSRRVPQLFARAASGNGAAVATRLAREVKKLPPETWPIIRAHWCKPRSFASMADHLDRLPESLASLPEDESLGAIPVAVLSAANSGAATLAEHAATSDLSTRGEHIIAETGGHWILLDHPEMVVEAVQKMIEDRGAGSR